MLVTMDCDGQHEPSRIPVLLEAIHDADIVSGSRYLRDFRQDTLAPQDRRRINSEITAELNRRFGLHLTDAFCGFKAYRREALERLHITETGWGMPLQLWVQAARLGLRIKEVGVPRLYLDPNRAFGGVLDDAAERLAYYRQVIAAAEAEPLSKAECAMPEKICPSAFCTRHSRGPVRERADRPACPGRRRSRRRRTALARGRHRAGDQPPAPACPRGRTVPCSAGPGPTCAARLARTPSLPPLEYLGENADPPTSAIRPARRYWSRGISRSCSIPASGSRTSPCTAWPARTAQRRSTSSSITTRSRRRLFASPRLRRSRRTGRTCGACRSTAGAARSLTRSGRSRIETAVRQLRRAGRRIAAAAGPTSRCCRRSGPRCCGRRNGRRSWASASRRRGGRSSARWGCHNLEVPLSRSAAPSRSPGSPVICWRELPRFHTLYNAVVQDYRRRHGIRSRNHPVPDLAAEGDWLEAPFWAWRAGGSPSRAAVRPHRRRSFGTACRRRPLAVVAASSHKRRSRRGKGWNRRASRSAAGR